ncbi:MAG TPA: biotin--[acetyl-CoA-carboxylase] ligase [Candidatus Nitrosopolaris sp.]|nr:biotin--[acetyl-CoA-carboxylase] ligase [Candidatus Nitrosopolaris sp.]
MIVQSIGKKLKTKLIGRQIYYYERLDSTQELAIGLAENNSEAVSGTAILAGRQERGKGRINSNWISPSGGIWLSIILIPNIPVDKGILLKFAAALAVCDAIEQKTGLESKVKWPNDILINHKKVCGILLDIATKGSRIEYAVIGIGINANVDVRTILPYIAGNDVSVTSLKNELAGKYVNRPSFLKLLFERFEHYYDYLEKEDLGGVVILNQIKDKLDILNAMVTVQQIDKTVEGLVMGLGLDGSLLLKKNDGSLIEVICGDTRARVTKQMHQLEQI